MATRNTRKKSRSGASKKRGARSKSGSSKSVASVAPVRFAGTISIAAVFVWGLYSLARQEAPGSVPASKPAAISPQASNKYEDEQNAVEAANNYTFYRKLKDFKIDVADAATTNDPDAPLKNVSYVIQAGSFKTSAQAEQLRAEMLLLGLEPRVEENRNSRSELWYRVMLGPYTSRSKMANVRTTLIENRIDAMVMQRRG